MTAPSRGPSRTPPECDYVQDADVCTSEARRISLRARPGRVHRSAEMCTHSAAEYAHTTEGPGRAIGRAALVALAAAVVLLAALSLAACGSSGSSTADSTAAPVKTSITAGAPKDASSEPPWNGRFVQVNVTTAKPAAMRPEDWHVSVNGKEPELDKGASILPVRTARRDGRVRLPRAVHRPGHVQVPRGVHAQGRAQGGAVLGLQVVS